MGGRSRTRELMFVSTLAACSAPYGKDTSPPEPSDADGGAHATNDAGDGSQSPSCNVIYVSNAGDDTNDGCSSSSPLRTIGTALSLVLARKLGGSEIRVCRGTYPERRLTAGQISVSIRGGYNCLTWTRAEGFGELGFEDPNLTRIENAGYDERYSTLVISGASDVVIEGVTVAGATSGARSGVALFVTGGAHPLLRASRFVGGGTSDAAAYGSVGVRV